MIYEYAISFIEYIMSNITSFLTLVTIIGTVLGYFHKQDKAMATASRNLYNELEDSRSVLNKKDPSDLCHITLADKENEWHKSTFYFRKTQLNHDFYDSTIYSGGIHSLEIKLQQSLQDIFRYIKLHNKYVNLVLDLDKRNAENEPPADYRYYKWLDEHEKILMKEIPAIMEKLEIYRHIFIKRKWIKFRIMMLEHINSLSNALRGAGDKE